MIILAFAIAFIACIVYSSFFEWTLHKYVMHGTKLLLGWKYAYRAHQLEHHEIFKADATYFFSKEFHDEDTMDHVTFAWWNAPLLFALHLPLFAVLWLWVGGWAAAVGAFTAMVSYYALYEYLHYCMHLPKDRRFERTHFFKFIQEHHRLHHVYYMKNLNVVVPIADFIMRTRVKLPQADFFDILEEHRIKKLTGGQAA